MCPSLSQPEPYSAMGVSHPDDSILGPPGRYQISLHSIPASAYVLTRSRERDEVEGSQSLENNHHLNRCEELEQIACHD